MVKPFMIRRLLATLFTVALAISLPRLASAAEVIYVDSIPLSRTDWKDSLTIPQFNPEAGELTRVELVLSSQIDGSGKFESMDGESANVTLKLAAEVDLLRPDGTWIANAVPMTSQQATVAAYDGQLDFKGASGRVYEHLIGYDKSDTILLTDPADLNLFIGTSTIRLPVYARGSSQGDGAGNLAVNFTTAATARVSVKYVYTEQDVEECPSVSIAYLGEGVGEYILPAGFETFVVKKFQPFRFEAIGGDTNEQGQRIYTSTRRAVHSERVWACSGECEFVKAFHESVELGHFDPGVTVNLLVIDDDVDERLNGWVADGNIDEPYLAVPEQAPIQALSLEIPFSADWSYHAVDSIGVVSVCVLPDASPDSWTIDSNSNEWDAAQRAAASTIAAFEMGKEARRWQQIFLPVLAR